MGAREQPESETSNGCKRYLLLPDRSTGPQAPQIRRKGIVFDPNTMAEFDTKLPLPARGAP
jgi:hypothetical protein